jgi:histone-lysine N-methyltransferase SETD2
MTRTECPDDHICENQKIRRRERGRNLYTQDAGLKGKGLFCGIHLNPGDFVIEYEGVPLSKEGLKLLEHLKDTDYVMKFGSTIVDGRRYLCGAANHSCTPNMVAEKWMVDDVERVGLFASKVIQRGEELTFDYGYHFNPCYCGCRNLFIK